MKSNKNEELKSRRDFFKKAAKSALPILGAVVLASSPLISKAAEATDCGFSCYGGCGGCSGTCNNKCNAHCKDSCYDSCRTSCSRICQSNSR